MENNDSEHNLFGVRANGTNTGFCLYVRTATGFAQHYIVIHASNTLFRNDTAWALNKRLTVGEFYNYKFYGYQKMVLTESGNEYTNHKCANNKPMLLFCRNTDTTPQGFGKFRIARCKIYDEHELERDFIPCYRKSDNVIGMYDLVYKEFYTNQGTGVFTKGNDVN